MGQGDLSSVPWDSSIEELADLRDNLDEMAHRQRRSLEETRHLAAIVESTTDAINGTDLDDRITSWNAAAEHLYGYSAQKMVGATISRLIPADRVSEPRRIRNKVGRGERIDGFETIRLDHAGRPIDVSLTVSPIRDHEGEVV